MPDKCSFLNDETAELIRRVYREDFVEFGYSLELVPPRDPAPVRAAERIGAR